MKDQAGNSSCLESVPGTAPKRSRGQCESSHWGGGKWFSPFQQRPQVAPGQGWGREVKAGERPGHSVVKPLFILQRICSLGLGLAQSGGTSQPPVDVLLHSSWGP